MKLRSVIKENKLFKDKKGDIFQIFFILIIVLVMAIVALLVGKMSYEFTEAFKTTSLGLNNSVAGTNSNNLIQAVAVPYMDFFIFFFFLGANIGLIIGAIKTKYTGVMAFLFILLILIEILVASGMVNIYQGFRNEVGLSPIPNQMTLTNILLSQYFPLIISIIGGVILIFMFSKTGQDANF